MPDKWDQYAQPAQTGEDKWSQYADTTPPDAPPPTMAARAFEGAKDFGKGLGESAVGLMSTGDEFARKHLPAFLTNTNMGFGPPADLQKVEQLGKPVNATQAVGAGLGDAMQVMIPVEKALPLVGKVGKFLGDAAEPVVNKVSELNQAWNPVPLRSRAINAFKTIENEAKDVPVNMAETEPAIGAFRDYVRTGGRGSPVINKLGRAVDDGPINFPEARKFYSNVTTATAKPGMLRRMIESPTLPKQRFNLGGVKGALNTDLTNAAESIGRGEQYTNALREYARNAQMRDLGKKALRVGVPVAAGAVGAKKASDLVSSFMR